MSTRRENRSAKTDAPSSSTPATDEASTATQTPQRAGPETSGLDAVPTAHHEIEQTLNAIGASETLRDPQSSSLYDTAPANDAGGDHVLDPDATVIPRGAGATPVSVLTHPPDPSPRVVSEDPMLRLRVGDEQAGRYTYISSQGAEGSELGRGAIGRVLIAADQHLGRDVAIKELLPEVFSRVEEDEAEDIRARFVREARITGQLEHPNIVPVYELGRRGDGRLYYTMKVIRGRTLEAAIDEAETLEARLALMQHFSGLCQAIAYAHSRGVVHRDIKPQNVMIGEFGETIVLDWGVAKIRSHSENRHSSLPPVREIHDAHAQATLRGNVFGTPIYMSPEQATGDVDAIDERSDVWSLGVVLYALLSGRLPFDGASVGDVIGRVMAGNPRPLRDVDERIPPELEAVTQRALERDRSKRYRSAKEMMHDVEAFLSGARVGAYAYSSWELLRRFVMRHRAAVSVAAVALVAGTVLAISAYRRVAEARDRALQAEEVSRESAERAQASLAQLFTKQAELALRSHDHTAAQLFAAKALSLEEIPNARGITVGLSNTFRPVPRFDFDPQPECERVWQQARHVVCRSGPEARLFQLAPVESWDQLLAKPESGDELIQATARVALGTRFGKDWQVTLSRDRALIAAHDSVVILELDSGKILSRLDNLGAVVSAVAANVGPSSSDPVAANHSSPRYPWLVGQTNGVFLLIDELGSPRPLGRLTQPVSAVALSDSEVAVGGKYGQLQLRRLDASPHSEPTPLVGHMGTITSLEFSPAGRWLASTGADRTVRLWQRGHPSDPENQDDTEPTQNRLQQTWPTSAVATSLDWSQDEQFLAFTDDDRGVYLADVRLAQISTRALGHAKPATLVRLLGNRARFMLSSSPDHPLRLWSLGSGPLPQRLVARGNILALASHTNAHAEATPALWAAGIGRNGVCLWNVEQGRCSTRLPIKAERVRALAISPDGARLAIAGSQGLLQVWDTAALIPVHILTGHSDEVRSLAFDETGTRLYSTGKDRQLILWDLTSGVALATAKLAGAGLALTRSPEGQVVVGTAQGALEFFNAQLSVAGDPLPLHDDWVMDIARSGEHLVTAGGDGKVVVWSFATQRIEHVLAGHVGRVVSVRASPDGRWVATSGEDRSVRIWATTDWSLAARLDDHQGTVRALSFVPKSSTLISAGDDRTMRFWDLSRMEDAGQNVLQHTQTSYRVRLEGTEVEPN